MRRLVLATRNKGKIKELRSLLSDLPFELSSLDSLASPPFVEEDRLTFYGNAVKKAEVVRDYCGEIVLADDSGLEVDVLGGYPGADSACFAGKGAGDEANNRKMLVLMQGIPENKRGARFKCAIAIAAPGMETVVVEGSCPGRIALAPRGQHGFGYDPLFIYEQEEKTFAELGEEFKNSISHRAHALRLAKVKIKDILGLHKFTQK